MIIYISIVFFSKIKIILWGPVVYEVLLKLYGQDLWPNSPIRGH